MAVISTTAITEDSAATPVVIKQIKAANAALEDVDNVNTPEEEEDEENEGDNDEDLKEVGPIFSTGQEANLGDAPHESATSPTFEKEKATLKALPKVDKSLLKFYLQQEEFVSEMEKSLTTCCKCNFKWLRVLPAMATSDGGVPSLKKPIESEEELIQRQKELVKREEAVIEQVKSSGSGFGPITSDPSAPLRSDSFEQLIRDTTGGGEGSGGSSVEVDAVQVAHRKVFIFYAALVVAIAVLLANKYFF
ncbi:hypothetical protein TYRP_013115 [Tyrophagus putrescentiae]|nr:hypothetical protein TYRP_013115 [Tyrophagus putrescentiae]